MVKLGIKYLGFCFCILLFGLFFFVGHVCATHRNYQSFDDEIAFAREAFEDNFHVKVKGSFAKNSDLFLSLFEQLENQQDEKSSFLRQILNDYSYLEFYREICKIDGREQLHGELLRMLEDINACKLFSPILTKLIILFFKTNALLGSPEKKAESMAYMLHDLEKVFLLLNTQDGTWGVSDQAIKKFIQLLQAYGPDKTLGFGSRVKSFVAHHSATLFCGAAFIFLAGVIKRFPSHINKEIKDFKDNEFTPWFDVNIKPVLDKEYLDKRFKMAIKKIDSVTKNAGKGVVEGLREALEKDPRLVADIVNNAIEGAAKNHDGDPNLNLDLIFERIINGVVVGMKKNRGAIPYILRPPDIADEIKINKKNEEAAAKLGKE